MKVVKSPVKVVVRARPTVSFASKNIFITEETGSILINIPKPEDKGYINHQQENWQFKFDKVLQNATQEVVYETCAKDIVNSVLEGYSGTILAYGQTGAGKTFTMCGSTQDYRYRGLIPRCISSIFQGVQSRYEQAVTVRVSYLEIYNEMMLDLLAATFAPEQAGNLSIQEDARGSINVRGLMMKVCSNEEEALSMFFEGETNRTITQHRLNANSSRSHCIFTLHIESRSIVESSEKVIYSKLNLVDLAGSERTKKTGSEGQTLVEAAYINKSLSFLEQVVVALAERSRDHIPYRQSKLTNLLKDSIGGNCKTLMVANIFPEAIHIEETISTMKFATRMMRVTNEAVVNIRLDPEMLIKKYEKEIRDLRQELAMHDTLANRGRINYEPYTPDQQYEMQKTAKKFLDGEVDDVEFDSLRMVKELFYQFRNIYRNLVKDIKNNNFVDMDKGGIEKKLSGKIQNTAVRNYDAAGVGQEDTKFGFGAGKAPKEAKPTQPIDNLVNIPKDEPAPEEKKLGSPEKKDDTSRKEKVFERELNVDKNQLFLEFKVKEGADINDSITKNVNDLKEKKEEIRQLSKECNDVKAEIEREKMNLQRKQEGKNQEEVQEGIIDEEEFTMIKELKDLKKKYKNLADKVKERKSAIFMIDQNLKMLKHQLLSRFEEFFIKRYGRTLDEPPAAINRDDDEDEVDTPSHEDVDQDALAYIKAKNKVNMLQKARKQEKISHKN